nr:hypothetical protein [Lysinibacillus timonensis]
MYSITFYENSSLVMSKLTTILPTLNEVITVKGRKGKVVRVNQLDDKTIHVFVEFEKVIKKQAIVEPNKKKR